MVWKRNRLSCSTSSFGTFCHIGFGVCSSDPGIFCLTYMAEEAAGSGIKARYLYGRMAYPIYSFCNIHPHYLLNIFFAPADLAT